MVAQRHADGHRAELERIEDVARERRPAGDDLVARVERRLADVADHRVGAGADGDLLEADVVPLGERGPEAVAATVRVPIELGDARSSASTAAGNGPNGPSLEASLTTRSSPSSRCTSSTGLPGSYGTSPSSARGSDARVDVAAAQRRVTSAERGSRQAACREPAVQLAANASDAVRSPRRRRPPLTAQAPTAQDAARTPARRRAPRASTAARPSSMPGAWPRFAGAPSTGSRRARSACEDAHGGA